MTTIFFHLSLLLLVFDPGSGINILDPPAWAKTLMSSQKFEFPAPSSLSGSEQFIFHVLSSCHVLMTDQNRFISLGWEI